jgi:hypothetical protein
MNESELASWMASMEERVRRLEGAVGTDDAAEATLTKVKALIKNGSNAYFNGVRQNPHSPGTREHELWQYGADIARDVSAGR